MEKKERNIKIAGAVLTSLLFSGYIIITDKRLSGLEMSVVRTSSRLFHLGSDISNLKKRFDSKFDDYSGEQSVKNKELDKSLSSLEKKLCAIEKKLKKQ